MRFERNEKRMTQPLEYLFICMKNDLRKGSTKCLQLRSLTHEQCGTGAWYRGIAGLRDPLVSAGSLPLATQCALMWAYRVVIVLNQDPPRQLIPQDKAATVVKCANTGLINLSPQRNHFCSCPALQCHVLFLVAISARQLRSCRRDPYRCEHLAFSPFSPLFTNNFWWRSRARMRANTWLPAFKPFSNSWLMSAAKDAKVEPTQEDRCYFKPTSFGEKAAHAKCIEGNSSSIRNSSFILYHRIAGCYIASKTY